MIDNISCIRLKHFDRNFKFELVCKSFGSSAVFPNVILALLFSRTDLLKKYEVQTSSIDKLDKSGNLVNLERKETNIIVVPFSFIEEFGKYLEADPYTSPMYYEYRIPKLRNSIYFDEYLKKFLSCDTDTVTCSLDEKIDPFVYCDLENKWCVENANYLVEITEDYLKGRVYKKL